MLSFKNGCLSYFLFALFSAGLATPSFASVPLLVLPEDASILEPASSLLVTWTTPAQSTSGTSDTSFDLFVRDDNERVVILRKRNMAKESYCDSDGMCSTQISLSMLDAKKYRVRIRSRSDSGFSDWSDPHRFDVVDSRRIAPSKPVVTSPVADGNFDSSELIDLNWTQQAVQGGFSEAATFDAYIYDRDKRELLWRNRNIDASSACNSVGECSWEISESVPSGNAYFVRVRAQNVAGVSPWSKGVRFSVAKALPLAFASSCTAATDVLNSYSGNLSGFVSGGEGPYVYEISNVAQRGVVDLGLNTGTYFYYPQDNGRGYMDSFDVTVRDQLAQQVTARVSIVYGKSRIMPVGDSITFGVENYNSSTGDYPLSSHAVGYRKRLSELLVGGGYETEFVGPRSSGVSAGLQDSRHAGFPGWTSLHIANGRQWFESSGHLTSWLDENPADVLLIHAGTNDHSTSTYGVGQILNKADTWALSNNVPLISMTATLIDQRRDLWNRNHLDIFNAAMPQVVAAADTGRLVDMFPVLDWSADLTTYPTDITGLHPNAGGYLKMADKWYQSLIVEGAVNKCP